MLRAQESRDEGFGLVEIIIAIVILGLVAIAVLPMIWQGLIVAGRQSTVATATQLVSATIDEARATAEKAAGDATIGCGSLPISRTQDDGRGVTLTISGVVVGGCGSFEAPATLKYTATVKDPSGASLAAATTLIYVPAPPEDTP